jgi:hypothetical protein
MAADKRFPSDANKPQAADPVKPDPEKVAAAKVAAVAKAEVDSGLKKSVPIGPMVQLEYSGKNVVVIDRVYSIGPGVNSMPVSVWKQFGNHPNMLALIKAGSLKVVSVPPDAPAAK